MDESPNLPIPEEAVPHRDGFEDKSDISKNAGTGLGIFLITVSFGLIIAGIGLWPISLILCVLFAVLGGWLLVFYLAVHIVAVVGVIQAGLNLLGVFFGTIGLVSAQKSRYRIPMTIKGLICTVVNLLFLAAISYLIWLICKTSPVVIEDLTKWMRSS